MTSRVWVGVHLEPHEFSLAPTKREPRRMRCNRCGARSSDLPTPGLCPGTGAIETEVRAHGRSAIVWRFHRPVLGMAYAGVETGYLEAKWVARAEDPLGPSRTSAEHLVGYALGLLALEPLVSADPKWAFRTLGRADDQKADALPPQWTNRTRAAVAAQMASDAELPSNVIYRDFRKP